MQEKNLKNIIVIKDVQSNLIEEAIIILKDNKKINGANNIEQKYKEINGEDFIVNQAQKLVEEYANNNENLEEYTRDQKMVNKKGYVMFGLIIIIQTIILILK